MGKMFQIVEHSVAYRVVVVVVVLYYFHLTSYFSGSRRASWFKTSGMSIRLSTFSRTVRRVGENIMGVSLVVRWAASITLALTPTGGTFRFSGEV